MWLYILLFILLLFAFLLIMPINLKASYKGSGLVSVRYLFFKIQLYPQKIKKDKKSKTKSKGEATKDISDEKKPKEKLSVKIREISDGISLIANAANRLLKHIKIKRFYLNINIGSPDAAATAIEYGAVSAALYPVCGFIFSQCKVDKKRFNANINARYDLEESSAEIKADITVTLISAIAIAILTLFKYILKIMDNNKESEIIKGGAVK